MKNKRDYENRQSKKRVMRQELKVEPILKKIREQQLKWLGHMTRMNNRSSVKKVWEVRMTGKGKRGRLWKT